MADKPTDHDVMKGGPEHGSEWKEGESGEAPRAPSLPPGMVKVSLGGQEFTVPEKLATAFQGETQALKKELGNLSNRYNALSGEVSQIKSNTQPREPTKTKASDYGTRLFEDPDGTIAELREKWKEEMRAELVAGQNAEKIRQDFWSDFYKHHGDLKGAETIVTAVANQHASELYGLETTEELRDRLAELTSAELMKIGVRAKTPPSADQTLEGSNTPTAQTGDTSEQQTDRDKVQSISDAIRQRRRQRQEARTGNRSSAR